MRIISLMGAAAALMLSDAPAERAIPFVPAAPLRRSKTRRIKLSLNRGNGAGYRRALAREARSRAWRRQFYAELDARAAAAA